MSKVVDGQQSLDFIPFSVPAIGEEEKAAVLRVMDSGWLTTAKEALAFEQEFARYVSDFQGGQTPHEIKALAVNSATSGLQLAYHACGVGDNSLIDGTGHSGKQYSTPGKILTTPYTFVSTATAACHLGGGVVYADVEADGYNIDPVQVERRLAQYKDIRAVVP